MKYKKHKSNKKSFLSKVFDNQLVIKVLSGLVIALASYFINHLQTSKTINKLHLDNSKLSIDNKNLSWGVDYYRNRNKN